jgi:7-cyano-7-deazaguanine synthase in queuosine biosynthesis
MAENPKPTTDFNQLTLIILIAQIEHLTKTLKAYYDQHQATACECSLCKEAERAFRRFCMTEIGAQ